MRIQTVQSHGKSLNIEGESAGFTGTEQYPELTTSGSLTTNKLPGVGLQPPLPVSEKRFLHNPTKYSLPVPRGLAVRPLYIYLGPPRDKAACPATPRRGEQPSCRGDSGSASKADVASARCAGSGGEKAAVDEGAVDGGRFRNLVERTTGRRETLRTQNKLHRLQKAFVLGLRTWPFSQRWCNTKEQGLCQRKLFTGYADGKAAKGSGIKTCLSPPGPASPPRPSFMPLGFSISHCSLAPSTTA